MRQYLATISVTTHGPGLYAFTDEAKRFIRKPRFANGLLTCFIRHTSASLLIQENADPDVLADIESFMRRLVSRDPALYRHTTEGPDDMPSHIRSALTASSLSIPICNGDLALGFWQGIYVFEHRDRAHVREVLLQAIGE